LVLDISRAVLTKKKEGKNVLRARAWKERIKVYDEKKREESHTQELSRTFVKAMVGSSLWLGARPSLVLLTAECKVQWKAIKVH
jgi:hypothetical protein